MRYIRMMALENALAEGNMISNIALTHLLDRPTGPMWIGPSIRSLERMELKMIENILSLKDVLVGIDVEYSHLRPLNLVVWSMHLEITDLVNERRKILALLEECMMVFEKRKVPNAAPYFGDIPGRPSAGKEETSEMAADDKNFIERSLAELRSGVKKHSEIPVLIPVMPAGDPESRPSFIPIFAVPSVIDRDDRRENFRAILPDEPEDVAGSRGKKDAPTIHSPMKVDGIIGGEAMTGDEYNIEGNMDAQRRSRLQSSMPSITGAMGAVGLLAAASRLMSPSGKEEMHPEEGLGAPVFFGMENEEKASVDPIAGRGMEDAFSALPGAMSMLSLAAVDSFDHSTVGSIRVELPDTMGETTERVVPYRLVEDDVHGHGKRTEMDHDPLRKMGLAGGEVEIDEQRLQPLKDESHQEGSHEGKKVFPSEKEQEMPPTLTKLTFPVPAPSTQEVPLYTPPITNEHPFEMKNLDPERKPTERKGRSHQIGTIMEGKTEKELKRRALTETNIHHISSAVSQLSNLASEVIPIVKADMGPHVPAPLLHSSVISKKKSTFGSRAADVGKDNIEGTFIPDPVSSDRSFPGNVPDDYSEGTEKGIPGLEHLPESTSKTIQWTPPGFGDTSQMKGSQWDSGPDRTRSRDPSYKPDASDISVEEVEIPIEELHGTEEAQRNMRYHVPSSDPSEEPPVPSIHRVGTAGRITGEHRLQQPVKGIAPDNEGDEYPLLEFLASYQGGRGADSRPGTYDAVGEIQETVPVDSLGPALSSYTPFRFVSGRILGSAMAPFSMLSNIFTDRQSIVETPLPVSMPGTSKTEDFREPGGLEAVPTAEEGGMAIGSVVEMEAKTLTVHRAMRRAAEIDAKTLPSVPDVGTLAIPRFPGFIETSDVTLDIPYGLIPEIPDLPVPTYWTCEVPGVKKDEYLHKLATMMGGEIIRDTVLGAVISKEDIGASPIHSFPGPAGKTESGAARHVPDVGRAGIVRVTPISPGTPARTSPLPKVPEPAATEKRSSDDPLSKSLERLRDMKRKDLLESDANETKKEKNDEMYGMVKSENEILGDMNRRDEFRMVEKMLEKEAKRYGLVFR